MIPNKIFLVGLPGSGKSYFGRKLAAEIAHNLVDLDAAIEAKSEKTIASLFKDKGEDYFRKIEAQILREVTARDEPLIVATGGGTPCFHNSMEYMLQSGVVVFLDIDEDILIERLSDSDKRPLIKQDVRKTILALKENRQAIYELAHIRMIDRDVEVLMKQISEL